MTEEDIKKQLEIKNKEIYRNKLRMDLNNNMDVLVLTIDNLLNKVTTNTVNYILGIVESFSEKENIEKDINEYITSYQDYLMKLLEDKKSKIEEEIQKTHTNYHDCFINETIKIRKLLDEYLKNNLSIINKIQLYNDDSFSKERIEKYFQNIFSNSLNDKIETTLKDRDVILLNTFRETYKKYLELNKNTVGN